jgi:DNA repair photolyase
MKRTFPVLRGRGTEEDPPNRFERLHLEPDPEEGGDPSLRVTQYFHDHSRSVLTRNHSPDVGFDWSVNPYRGCEHGCVYCLSPESAVLLPDLRSVAIGEVRAGDVLLGFDEHPGPGRGRTLKPALVEAVWWSRKPTIRIITDRAEVVATAEHRWLLAESRWIQTDRLAPGDRLRFLRPTGRDEAALAPAGPIESEAHCGTISGIALRPGIPERAREDSPQLRFGSRPPTDPARILAIEPGPVMDVVDIQTSTGTFYAGGLATHNCYARPTHEYLGLSAGLDFESKIFVKLNAPALLERRLASPGWKPQHIAMSGVTDPYQPVERRLAIARGCLEVLARTRHPVAIVTKSRLVERDVDLLAELARFDAVQVAISITTLDRALQRAMEPRASPPEHRLAAVRTLASAGVPVTVFVAPVIPGLTDHEIPSIVEAAAEAGASGVGHVLLRLPGAVESIFLSWMEEHCPDRAEKIKSRLRSMRGGRLNESAFGKRMRGEGPFAAQITRLFEVARARSGLRARPFRLSTEHFRRPSPRPGDEGGDAQLELL